MKALGIKPELVPTCNVLHPKNGDCFLICSDGLNGMITDSTIKGVLKQDIPLADKGERLIQLALEAGGHDNITVELIQITSSPHTQSQFISFNPASTKRTIPPTPTDRNKRTHTNHSLRIKKVALWVSAIVVFIVVCLLLFSVVSKKQNTKEIAVIENQIKQYNEKIKNNIQNIQSLEVEIKDNEQKAATARKNDSSTDTYYQLLKKILP